MKALSPEEVSALIHDVRGSVAAAHGFLAALREETGEALTPEARSYVDRVERNLRTIEAKIEALAKA